MKFYALFFVLLVIAAAINGAAAEALPYFKKNSIFSTANIAIYCNTYLKIWYCKIFQYCIIPKIKSSTEY